jgi:hypothetical protein
MQRQAATGSQALRLSVVRHLSMAFDALVCQSGEELALMRSSDVAEHDDQLLSGRNGLARSLPY